MHYAAAVEIKEVTGKDGRMKEVRRKMRVDAHGNPVARKVHIQGVASEMSSPLPCCH